MDDRLRIFVDYAGPDGPAKVALQQRVRAALTSAGLPLVEPPKPSRPALRVIRGGGGQQ
jgi:hypothetical protein